MLKNNILETSIERTDHDTLNFFTYMDLESSERALCAIVLLIGISFYLSRKPLSKMVDHLKDKVSHYAEGNLFPHTPILKLYYDRGFFTLYWTIVWLVCRFTIIQPIYLNLSEIIESVILAQLFAISLSMLIALIPSLMLTAVEDLNELISALHFKLCSTYRTYLKIILRLFVFHSYTTNNEIRAFIRFLSLLSLFIGYLLTNSPVILSLWLTIIYLGIYFRDIISKIVAGDKINGPAEIIHPELFLYSFRFHYWENALPYFYNQNAYEEGYHFGALDRETFFSQVKFYNEHIEWTDKLKKRVEDPRYIYTLIILALRSDKIRDEKTIKTLKKNLISFEKVILEQYPETQDSIEVFREEILEKYPEWRADFTKKKKFTDIKKRSSKQKHTRSYQTSSKSLMMNSDDFKDDILVEKDKPFAYPSFDNPVDVDTSEFDEAIRILNVRPEDGETISEEITDDGVSWVVNYKHPNDNQLSYMRPGNGEFSSWDSQIRNFLPNNEPKITATIEHGGNSTAAAAAKTIAAKASGKMSIKAAAKTLANETPQIEVVTAKASGKISEKASSVGTLQKVGQQLTTKGVLTKIKTPGGIGIAAVVGTVAAAATVINSVESTAVLMGQPDSVTQGAINAGKEVAAKVKDEGPEFMEKLGDHMARDRHSDDTLKVAYGEPDKPRSLLSRLWGK